jgi:hypothetical protein
VNHAEVRALYLNYVAAQEALGKAMAFGQFTFAGITFVNYRGTDDNSTVAIGVKKAKFFCDAPGLFQAAWGPAEFMDAVGMPGEPMLPLDAAGSVWPQRVRLGGALQLPADGLHASEHPAPRAVRISVRIG